MELIRTLIFKILFYIMTAIFVLVLSVSLFVPGWRIVGRALGWWGDVIIWLIGIVVGVKVEFRGLENIPKEGPLIFSTKHESTMDALVSCKLFPEASGLAKSPLFYVPFLGQLLYKMGLIPVVRGKGTAHQHLPDVVKFMKKTKRPLMVFPEGTRAMPGQILPLKSGAFHIQEGADIPVYTAATNAGYFWPARHFRMKPGTMIYEIHSPIEKNLSKEDFMQEIKVRLMDRSDALRLEAQKKDRLNRPI